MEAGRVGAPNGAARGALEQDGYLGPVPLLTPTECRRVVHHLARSDLPAAAIWDKGRAVGDRMLYDIASRPAILEVVTAALGPDVVLWGASAVSRAPGQAHAWHSDIESSDPEGGFVSVWIGLENTSRKSSLQVIAGSHLSGRSLQEARAVAGIERDEASPAMLVELARRDTPGARLVTLEARDGDAVFFDGRLWHGTLNERRRGARLALLLQFARADREVRIPDWDELDWPFRIRRDPRPPVIVVSGTADGDANEVVAAPTGWSAEMTAAAHRFELPPGEETDEPWRPFPAFHGATPVVDMMSCHASVLQGGHSPHPPHAHVEEEILLALHGSVEILVARAEDDRAPRVERLEPGFFVYYPSWQWHTVRNDGTAPAAYLMLKWRGGTGADGGALATTVARPEAAGSTNAPFSTSVVLEGATAFLAKLHAHVSVLQPDAGYEPHRDAYDVAIVLLEGEIETLGRRVHPSSVVYCAAGQLHGMHNPGAHPARYLVFELHPAARGRPVGRSVPARALGRLRRARARRP